MSQYSIVTTGLSSGLGAYAKNYMEKYYDDWYHIMLCRNPDRVEPRKNLTVIGCNLLSIESVKGACRQIKDLVELGKVPPIKYLLFNAAVGHQKRTISSEDGFEDVFHVNVISNYILTNELLPILTSNARVLFTGSDAHKLMKIFWDDNNLDPIVYPVANAGDKDPDSIQAGFRAYTTSKLALIYLAHQFARENPNVKFLVYHPGVVPTTGLSREMNVFLRTLARVVSPFLYLTGHMITSETSGKKLAKYMFNDDLFGKCNNCLYSEVGKIMKSSPESYNKDRELQLWKFLKELD